MNRKLTKDALLKFQSQVLSHFSQSEDSEERSALLELVKAIEKSSTVLQEQKEKSQGKSPFADDLTASVTRALKKKGEINTIPPFAQSEMVEDILRREACR